MKACSKCFELKEFDEFNLDSKVVDGYHYYCRPCYSIYRKLKGFRYPEAQRKSYYKHRDKIFAARRIYAEANKTKLYKRSRELYDLNRDKINARARELYHLDRKKNRQKAHKYYKENKKIIREKAYKRIYGDLADAFKSVYQLEKEIRQCWKKNI